MDAKKELPAVKTGRIWAYSEPEYPLLAFGGRVPPLTPLVPLTQPNLSTSERDNLRVVTEEHNVL